VADAQEIIVGDGVADRPVLYYSTNHNSCFTTSVVGFKECLGSPVPVLVQRGQSSRHRGSGSIASPGSLGVGAPAASPRPRLEDLLQAEDHVRVGWTW